MAVLILIISCVLAYLLGSISFAVIISERFIKKDVRELGSGNAGMTNVMRNAGVLPGLLTFVLDCLKGIVAGLLGKLVVFPYLFSITHNAVFSTTNGALVLGIFCMLGHLFPIFFQFKGGKGVATVGGVGIAACPLAFLVALAFFLAVTIITKMVSAGSIAAAVTLPFAIFFLEKYYNAAAGYSPVLSLLLMGCMCLCVIIKHSENIKRILKGTERKLGDKK